ncbi:hypothetical protein A1O3_08906 [Capronia epimyces CBS 606.96]|uniref:Uncharacterized protein n=1 Tax=Capronia epimyces CBS 606.96 TaxID=1182542 RepID=W9YAL6_9EURO|nr:uncharacterized protein A1O3_08906 [Capronia epimyces CBS 606.96]EXJ79404.1 hypothetical protein A1O3_08906 [Capronia epimyces CBS 606.96]
MARPTNILLRLSRDNLERLPQLDVMSRFLNSEDLGDRLLNVTITDPEGGDDALEELEMWISLVTAKAFVRSALEAWETHTMFAEEG